MIIWPITKHSAHCWFQASRVAIKRDARLSQAQVDRVYLLSTMRPWQPERRQPMSVDQEMPHCWSDLVSATTIACGYWPTRIVGSSYLLNRGKNYLNPVASDVFSIYNEHSIFGYVPGDAPPKLLFLILFGRVMSSQPQIRGWNLNGKAVDQSSSQLMLILVDFGI